MFPLDTDYWVNILLFIMSNYTNTCPPRPIGPHKVLTATQLLGWSELAVIIIHSRLSSDALKIHSAVFLNKSWHKQTSQIYKILVRILVDENLHGISKEQQ